MKTPIADKFYADAKDVPVERRGQIIAQAYSTIVELEQDAARYRCLHNGDVDGVIIMRGHVDDAADIAALVDGDELDLLVDAAISQSQPDHPFSGSSGND